MFTGCRNRRFWLLERKSCFLSMYQWFSASWHFFSNCLVVALHLYIYCALALVTAYCCTAYCIPLNLNYRTIIQYAVKYQFLTVHQYIISDSGSGCPKKKWVDCSILHIRYWIKQSVFEGSPKFSLISFWFIILPDFS